MAKTIDDTVNEFIEKLQHESVDGDASGSGYMQAHPAAAPLQGRRHLAVYGGIATLLIVLLLAAMAASYAMYRAERDAITSRIDAIVSAPLEDPLEQRLLELEKNFGDTGNANARRIQALEQRFADNQQAHAQQLQDLEQRLMQVYEPQEHRLQRVEQQLARVQSPDGKRLQAIENRLVQITARMDGWAAVMADLSNKDQSAADGGKATAAEPPAARSIEPVVLTRNDVVLQHPLSLPEALQDERQRGPDTSAAQAGQGDWVINIGSYLHEKTAARKLDDFQARGVTAELVSATVRGKTIYRIQVPGFASMSDARRHASQVRDKLGLGETWIRRR